MSKVDSFLREAAADMLLTSMRIQRDKLKAILTTAGGCQLKKQNIIFNFPKNIVFRLPRPCYRSEAQYRRRARRAAGVFFSCYSHRNLEI